MQGERLTEQRENLYSGTDGVRGVAGEGFLTEEFMRPLGTAIGLRANRGSIFVVGRDTRESGDELAEWMIEGLLDAGVDVVDLGKVPTPAIAYILSELNSDPDNPSKYAGGVMFTASHNPARDNGQKNFGPKGRKLSDKIEEEISDRMWELRDLPNAPHESQRGRLLDGAALLKLYEDFLLEAGRGINFDNTRFAIDCAYGSASGLAPKILTELGAAFIPINADLNAGAHINEGCGATHLDAVRQIVLEEDLDFGVAYDGDADRALFVAKSGRVFDGDDVLNLLARQYGVEGIVATIMMNMGMSRELSKQGITVFHAGVGDRYVAEALDQLEFPFGAEKSGHAIFSGEHTTGDGIFTMLKVIKALQDSGKSMDEWLDSVQLYPQVLINVPLKQMGAGKHEAVQKLLGELKIRLAGSDKNNPEGDAFGRDSGTEPLLRVLATRRPMQENLEEDTEELRAYVRAWVAEELQPLLRELKFVEELPGTA